MFRNREEKRKRTVDTLIASSTTIEGKITHPKSLRIDGKVNGEIDCEGDVHIGKSGKVEPVIRAKNLYIAGKVKGDVYVTEKVHLMETGKLSGNVTSNGIIIDDGGQFVGNSDMQATKKKDQKNNSKLKRAK